METISGYKINLPKRINCRVDVVHIGGKPYAALVDYLNNEILFLDRYNGQQTIGNLYKDFKWCAVNELPIDVFSFAPLPYPFKRLENIEYKSY